MFKPSGEKILASRLPWLEAAAPPLRDCVGSTNGGECLWTGSHSSSSEAHSQQALRWRLAKVFPRSSLESLILLDGDRK